ncbi:hypothetical protein ACJX0J_019208, partial [Zea mays]
MDDCFHTCEGMIIEDFVSTFNYVLLINIMPKRFLFVNFAKHAIDLHNNTPVKAVKITVVSVVGEQHFSRSQQILKRGVAFDTRMLKIDLRADMGTYINQVDGESAFVILAHTNYLDVGDFFLLIDQLDQHNLMFTGEIPIGHKSACMLAVSKSEHCIGNILTATEIPDCIISPLFENLSLPWDPTNKTV